MTRAKAKYYIRGTLVILVIFALILLSCFGFINNPSDSVRHIFYIVYFSLLGACVIAYWIYAFARETRLRKEKEADDGAKERR